MAPEVCRRTRSRAHSGIATCGPYQATWRRSSAWTTRRRCSSLAPIASRPRRRRHQRHGPMAWRSMDPAAERTALDMTRLLGGRVLGQAIPRTKDPCALSAAQGRGGRPLFPILVPSTPIIGTKRRPLGRSRRPVARRSSRMPARRDKRASRRRRYSHRRDGHRSRSERRGAHQERRSRSQSQRAVRCSRRAT